MDDCVVCAGVRGPLSDHERNLTDGRTHLLCWKPMPSEDVPAMTAYRRWREEFNGIGGEREGFVSGFNIGRVERDWEIDEETNDAYVTGIRDTLGTIEAAIKDFKTTVAKVQAKRKKRP